MGAGDAYYFGKDETMAGDKWLQLDGSWHDFYPNGKPAKSAHVGSR